MTDKPSVAFLGLGTMGYPMAGHLAARGYSVCVYNRTRDVAGRWVGEHGHRLADTPAEAAVGAELVFACVGNDDSVRAITQGEGGAFAGMRPGAVFVDHTTASAELARELNRAARKLNLDFIDAPVSGGQSGAEQGILTVMAGGDEAAFARAREAITCYAKRVCLLGDSGAGQLTKMVNQLCIAGLVQSLAEATAFARNAGLDGKQVFEVLGGGAAQSWQMDNRHATMLDDKFDFGFAVDWMRKDLGYAMDEAGRNGAELPVAELVDRFYAEIQAMGGGRWDTSSLIRRLSEKGQAGR